MLYGYGCFLDTEKWFSNRLSTTTVYQIKVTAVNLTENIIYNMKSQNYFTSSIGIYYTHCTTTFDHPLFSLHKTKCKRNCIICDFQISKQKSQSIDKVANY